MTDRIYGRKLDIEEVSPPKPTSEPTSSGTTYQERVKHRLWHIETYPEFHRHSFEDLHRCSIIDGILDTRVLDAHSEAAPFGYNGGIACDVSSGPCACGAWH